MSQGLAHHIPPDPLPGVAPDDRARATAPRAVAGHSAGVARHEDLLLKLIVFAATPLVSLLIYVKYLPDYAMVTPDPVPLSSYTHYWDHYYGVEPFRARFASNYTVYYVAKAIEAVIRIPGDPRIHPLRLSAALITTVCLWLVALPILLDRRRNWDWRVFYTGLLVVSFFALYQFNPSDFPSLVFVSMGLVFLLNKQRVLAMVALLICGLFRESNIHIAWFAVSMLVIPQLNVGIGWAAGYVVAFLAEWWVIRKVVFNVGGNDVWMVMRINLTSPTAWTMVMLTLCLAALAYVVIAARRARARARGNAPDPLDTFFLIQVLWVPVWLVFYLFAGSNWTEFRVQLPTLLPLVFALAYRPREAQVSDVTQVPSKSVAYG